MPFKDPLKDFKRRHTPQYLKRACLASKEWRKKNPERKKENEARWRKENPKQTKLLRRRSLLKRSYGMTVEKYNQMFAGQNGVCAICFGESDCARKELHVDHNHKTGKVRALLCASCNLLVGNSKEKISILFSAINYIKKYNS